MIVIYKITNPKGKVYIGQTWNFEKRIQQYKWINQIKKQTYISRSLVKYGFEKHKIEIIKYFDDKINQDLLDNAERFYIFMYKSIGSKMMNLTNGGKGGKGTKRNKAISYMDLYNYYIIKNKTKKEIAIITNKKERLIKKYLSEYKIFKPHSLKIKRDEEVKNKSRTRIYEKDILKYRNEKMSYKEIMKLIPVTHAVIANTISKNKKIKL